MSDNNDDSDVQLSLGFDTSSATAAGQAFVKAGQAIQDSARATAQVSVDSARIMADADGKVATARAAHLAEIERLDQQARTRRAQEDRDAAEERLRQQQLASGQLAKEYVQSLQAQFKLADDAIKMQAASGLLNKQGAADAARQNAVAYNNELKLALSDKSSGSLFGGIDADKQAAALATATNSLKTITVASEGAKLSFGRLRFTMISLLDSVTGLPPVLGQLVGALGSFALGLAPLLALIGTIALMAELWKGLQTPMEDAKKANTEYNESAKATHDNLVALNKELGVLGQTRVTMPSAELEKLDEQLKKMVGDLSGSNGFFTNLRAMGQELRTALNPNDNTIHLEMLIGGINQQLKDGKINADQYAQSFLDLAKKYPSDQDLIAPWLKVAGAIQGVTEKMAQVTAQTDAVIAQQHTLKVLYGDPAYAKAAEANYNLAQQLHAVQSGGKDALAAIKDQQKATAEGEQMWTAYATSLEHAGDKFHGVILATISYKDAVNQGVPAAQHIATLTETQAATEVKLTTALEASNKARAEKKRLDTESAEHERTLTTGANSREDTLQQANQLVQAALQGNDAYARLDTQLKTDAQIKTLVTSITKEATDAQTGQLLISKAELANRIEVATATVQQTDAYKTLATEIQANNTTEAATKSTLALAAAWESGAMAAKDEAVEVKYLQDLLKANSMADDGQRARAVADAAAARDATLRLNQAKAAATEREKESKTDDRAAEEAAKKRLAEVQQLTHSISSLFNTMFENILSGGTDIFGKLADNIKQIFLKLVAQMAAQKLGQLIASNLLTPQVAGLSSSVFSPEMLAKAGGGSAPSGAMAGALGGAGIVLGAGLGGFAIGQSAGSYGTAALGGAASGAAMGAAIGSVVPVVGTAVGAVVGAVAGLAGGLFGHASAIKKAAKEFEEAQQKFVDSFAQFPSQYAADFAGITKSFQDLEDAATKAHTVVSAQAAQAAATAKGQIQFGFANDIQGQYNDVLGGQAGQLGNAINQIDLWYTQAIRTAKDLSASQETLNQIEAIYNQRVIDAADAVTKATDAAKAQAAQANKDAQGSYTLRMLSASGLGNSDQALALQQQAELQKAIADGLDDTSLAMLKLAQQDEFIQHKLEEQRQLLQQQLSVLQTAQQTLAQSLSAQQTLVDTDQKVVDTLAGYRAGLNLNQSLTTLSPSQQLDAARTAFTTLAQKALTGDAASANNLPGASDTFLNLSRQYNASGSAYGADFNLVQSTLATVQDKFGEQLSTEQAMLAQLTAANDKLTLQLALIQKQIDATNALPGGANDQKAAQLALQKAADQQAQSLKAQLQSGSYGATNDDGTSAQYTYDQLTPTALTAYAHMTVDQQVAALKALNDEVDTFRGGTTDSANYNNDNFFADHDPGNLGLYGYLEALVGSTGATGGTGGNAFIDNPSMYKFMTDDWYTSQQAHENSLAFAPDQEIANLGRGITGYGAGYDPTTKSYPALQDATTLTLTAVQQSSYTELQKQTLLLQSIATSVNGSGTAIPHFATGGFHPGGWHWTGERGPELVNSGPSAIYSTSSTQDMLDKAFGGSNEVLQALREIGTTLQTIRDDQRQTGSSADTRLGHIEDALEQVAGFAMFADKNT